MISIDQLGTIISMYVFDFSQKGVKSMGAISSNLRTPEEVKAHNVEFQKKGEKENKELAIGLLIVLAFACAVAYLVVG